MSSPHTHDSTAPSTLRRDQVVVTVAAVVWIVGTLLGFGVIGGTSGVEEQGEGLFSDSATLVAPHGPAFSIWSVIYVFLALYVVWQWLPAAAGSDWARVTRIPAAASLALNGLWLVVVWLGWVFVSVLVMLGIVVSLGVILARIASRPWEGWVPGVVVGVTFGLYLGWICVATVANITSWAVGLGAPAEGWVARTLAVVVLGVVVALAAFLLVVSHHILFQTALVAALTWGLSWAAVGRFIGETQDSVVAWAAVLAAVAVVALWLLEMTRGIPRPRDAQPSLSH